VLCVRIYTIVPMLWPKPNRQEDGCTPLNLAAIRGNVAIVKRRVQRFHTYHA
jgi:hypothetical protein